MGDVVVRGFRSHSLDSLKGYLELKTSIGKGKVEESVHFQMESILSGVWRNGWCCYPFRCRFLLSWLFWKGENGFESNRSGFGWCFAHA